MAKRKLTYEDIRVSCGFIVIAAPRWAYAPYYAPEDLWHIKTSDGIVTRPKGDPTYYRPIEELWGGILDEVARKRSDFIEAEKQRQLKWPASMRTRLGRVQPLRSPDEKTIKTCPVCRYSFFGLGSTTTCTEACAKIRRKQVHVHSKQPRPHVSHDERLCPQCRVAFTPRRSDAVFCSGRCRVAHHRERSRPIHSL
jgi:hypothetical protein